VSVFILLTWLGSCPAESPYTEVALVLTLVYFVLLSVISVWSYLSSFAYLK
jgi:hypothetical protein